MNEDVVRIDKYADGKWKVSADLGDAGRTRIFPMTGA